MKKWLIISYFANIDAMAPSHHIDDRLSELNRRGLGFTLLSSPCGQRFTEYRHVRVPSPAPSGIRYEVRHFLRRTTGSRLSFKTWETLMLLPVLPFYFIEKTILRLDTTWSWFLTATPAAISLIRKNRPDVIYSTGGPVSAHIAALYASRATGVPYISEFQDPLVHQYAAPGKFERHFIERVERMIFQTAGAAVFLTEKAAGNAKRRNPGEEKSFFIHAGAAPVTMSARYERTPFFSVAHFGSLGGSRNLDCFLQAWETFLGTHSDIPREARLHLYGSNKKNLNRVRDASRHPGTIVIHGKIPRAEALHAMKTVDVLLLIQNRDDVSFETIPSKVYEYLLAGRPVLALVFRNPELGAILTARGHLVVEADDPVSVGQALSAYHAEWKTGALRTPQDSSPYTIERAVDRLISIAGTLAR